MIRNLPSPLTTLTKGEENCPLSLWERAGVRVSDLFAAGEKEDQERRPK